ncbi:MAG: DUF3267 domain-containing protein, partial [Oscillospiraceae bacterium]|nr:DUF3267 domain-containing protein [Oscillospiraceae bacterium]
MINNTITLPPTYRELLKIDLQKDKKTMILVNALSLIIAILMVAGAVYFVPLVISFGAQDDLKLYFLHLIGIVLGMVLYLVLHELVHGIFMKRYSGEKVKYGFTGLYAFAGSMAYFNKKCYIIIALAPVV